MTHDLSYDGPIGVFDSGFGGLTILREIRKLLPDYTYVYLGDSARAPYGGRSFETVYRFTLEGVMELFRQGCPLVILACNTASAKALRSIQQCDLPHIDASRRVLGVIRPTVEALGELSRSGSVGVLGTEGTVRSRSYDMEVAKLYPGFTVYSQACPMLAPLVESGETQTPGADYYVQKYMQQLMDRSADIDTIVLGCTHYPLLIDSMRRHAPAGAAIVEQGTIVARSLADYLRRHPEMESRLTHGGGCRYLTTEQGDGFARQAEIFINEPVHAERVRLKPIENHET